MNLFENVKENPLLKLSKVRIAFVDALFEAKAYKAGDKKRFSTKFLFAKDSPYAKLVKDAMRHSALVEFGDPAEADKALRVAVAEAKLCLTDGDIKDYDGYAGNYVLGASNKIRPTILGPNKENLTEKDGKIYSGCYVNAHVRIWFQNNDWGRRVNCSLEGVQFVADGESFSGGKVSSPDEFDAVPAEPALTADSAKDFM